MNRLISGKFISDATTHKLQTCLRTVKHGKASKDPNVPSVILADREFTVHDATKLPTAVIQRA
jgi:hypothetical protein